MLSRVNLLLGLGVVLANVSRAQQLPFSTLEHAGNGRQGPILTPEFRAQLGELLSDASIPGYSIALVKLDEDVEFGNWGVRTEEGDPMTSDTLYILASVSKQFTATALGLIIDDYAQGRNETVLPNGLHELSWSTKVKDILPDDWALMDPWANEKASLNDVLSHVSGVANHELAYKSQDTSLERVRLLRYLRPDFELREHWHYNNQMYMMASHIIAVLSNSTYGSFLQRRIFTPFNMTLSTVDPAAATQSITHAWADTAPVNRRVPELLTPSEARLIAGAGAVMSSAEDMARWVKVLLKAQKDDEANEKQPVPGSVIREVMRPMALVGGIRGARQGFDTERTTYGKGWMQMNYRGHRYIQHGGSWIGYSTLVSLYPDEGFGIVQLANSFAKGAFNLNISLLIADAALGLEPLPQPERTSVLKAFPSVDIAKPAAASTKIPHFSVPCSVDNSFRWPLETFAQTYTDLAYGSITLCTAYSTSPPCRRVLAAYSSISPNGTVDENHLYAEWLGPVASHMRFVPLSSEQDMDEKTVAHFELQPRKLYPEGHGANKTAFELNVGFENVKADFLINKKGEVVGMGWTGLVGEETDRARKPGSVEEKADVWFIADRK